MHNNILDALTDYPFDRLRALLRDVKPPAGQAEIHMQIGEPKHAPPEFIGPILVDTMADWGRYPPPNGTETLRAAIADWLATRYELPAGMIDPAQNIAVVSGTREALFMAALLAVPEQKAGAKPIVLMPNPFYQVYLGAAVMARAETVLLPAGPETGFQPDFASLDPAILERTALAYLNSPANPQGSIADLEMLESAIELARRYDFVLAVDECYSEIYTAEPPPGGLSACAKIADGGVDTALLVGLEFDLPGLRLFHRRVQFRGDRATLGIGHQTLRPENTRRLGEHGNHVGRREDALELDFAAEHLLHQLLRADDIRTRLARLLSQGTACKDCDHFILAS